MQKIFFYIVIFMSMSLAYAATNLNDIDPKVIISYSLYLRDGSCYKEGRTAVCYSDEFQKTFYYKCKNGKAYEREGYYGSWKRETIYDKACQ